MLWISAAAELASILSNAAQLNLLSGSPFTVDQADANDLRQMIVQWGGIGVFLATGIPFLMWIYRAGINCRGFGARRMSNTPGWAVGWYFVPIACLFKPYQAMNEIWKVSKDPMGWYHRRSSYLMGAWWALWVSGGILSAVTRRMPGNSLPEIRSVTILVILSGIHGIALSLVAMKLLKAIIRKQDRLVGYRRR